MLVSRLGNFEGLRVADLFAGSGALGLEVLSRGAAHCTFVELDGAALDALRTNISKLNASATVWAKSATSLGAATSQFDLILMDPPYGTGAGSVALDKLYRLGWVSPATLVSIETSKAESVEVKGFDVDVVRDYGKARVTLLRATATEQPS